MPEPTTRDSFTTEEAARIANVAPANLRYWIRSKLVKPARLAKGCGIGLGHVFAFRELVEVRTIERLRSQGISLQAIRRVAVHLRRSRGWEDPLARARLVVAGDDVVVCEAGKVESTLERPGALAFYFVVDLEATAREVRQAIVHEAERAA